MKNFLLLITTLLIGISGSGQVSDTIYKESQHIRLYCKAQELEDIPYFFLMLGENEIELDNEKLGLIDIGWIENLNVLTKEIAIKKFGSKAKHGAISVRIKEKNIKDLKEKLRTKNR